MEKITPEQYEYLLPINEKYSKWIDDRISAMRVYKPFLHLFEAIYYHFYKRNGKWHFLSEAYEESFDGILELVKEKSVTLTDSKNLKRVVIPSVFDLESEKAMASLETLILDDSMRSDNWNTDVGIISEVIERHGLANDELLRVYMLNTEGNNPRIGDIFLIENVNEMEQYPVNWEKVNDVARFFDFAKVEAELARLCMYTPQIEFFAIDVIPTLKSSSGFKIVNMHSNPSYPTTCIEGFSEAIDDYLRVCLQVKQENFSQTAYEKRQQELQERKQQAELLYPRGYYPFLEATSSSDFLTNFKSDRVLKLEQEESWVSERRFNHHRIEQYGIDGSNHEGFISDFEYEYLAHINNKYRVWFEDKVTIKYILNDFSECMTAYYYLIATKNGKNKVIPLMDCPEDYKSSYEDIFRLVRAKGILALKLDQGTHGKGFFKFTFVNGKYYLNEEESGEEDIIALLSGANQQYLVTEFIQQHPSLAHVYSGSVNTARLLVFKKDGRKAQIGNGYVRFGHSGTGGVDNMGAGGIGADLDVATGYYSNGARIKDNRTVEYCEKHPDTGVRIEGYLPNWDDTVEMILRIAEAMPEIEYMGFDVAFTENGIKLPEINRFPDFPKINKLSAKTLDYLLHKLEVKKMCYGWSNSSVKNGNEVK